MKQPPIPRAALALPLLAFFASAACSSPTFEDRCASAAEIGRLHLRLLPEPGLFGYAQMIEVGDTLRFGALLQPEVGASTDLWGGGGCKIHYGDPVAATLEWRTSNVQIFSVDAEGLVTGRAAGEAVLTARAVSHGMEQSRELTIYTGYPFGSR